MTELYLRKGEGQWQRAYFDTSVSGIKLTRENPYFTQSESYTLDVTLPMDIMENRNIFGNLQRIDRSKESMKLKCLLRVDNFEVMHGTASVIQVTDREVKIQLLSGDSELNSKAGNVYLDELDLGVMAVSHVQPSGYDNYNEAGVRFLCLQGYDETRRWQP